jgi:hypothetical protein
METVKTVATQEPESADAFEASVLKDADTAYSSDLIWERALASHVFSERERQYQDR